MTGLIMFLHALVAILLITAVLMQSGRGGGLTEAFASAESVFGARTNEFMIKTTTVLATVFFLTCIGLAILSSQRGRSLMSNTVATETPPAPAVESAGEAANVTPATTAEALETAAESVAGQTTGLEVHENGPSEDLQAQTPAPGPETPPQAEPVPAAPVAP